MLIMTQSPPIPMQSKSLEVGSAWRLNTKFEKILFYKGVVGAGQIILMYLICDCTATNKLLMLGTVMSTTTDLLVPSHGSLLYCDWPIAGMLSGNKTVNLPSTKYNNTIGCPLKLNTQTPHQATY